MKTSTLRSIALISLIVITVIGSKVSYTFSSTHLAGGKGIPGEEVQWCEIRYNDQSGRLTISCDEQFYLIDELRSQLIWNTDCREFKSQHGVQFDCGYHYTFPDPRHAGAWVSLSLKPVP